MGLVATGDLQVASADVTLVEGDFSVVRYFLCVAASHVVVGAFDYRVAFIVCESHRAVFGVVGDSPDAGGGFHLGLVAVGVVGRYKGFFRALLNRCVLVEGVGRVGRGFFCCFLCTLSIADVIVVVAVGVQSQLGIGEFAAGVVAEAVLPGVSFLEDVAGSGPSEAVVAVAAGGQGGAVFAVGHLREEVAPGFIGLRQGHAVGHGELLQEA